MSRRDAMLDCSCGIIFRCSATCMVKALKLASPGFFCVRSIISKVFTFRKTFLSYALMVVFLSLIHI